MMFSARFYYALALFHAGRLGESVDEWREMLESHDEYRAQNPINSVEVHYWLGRAYEASGWTVQAQDQYRTFTRIWKTADPGLTAFADANARLRQLAQIH
jgi:tetratricopeptide (TPR) repeat protein